MNYDVFYCCYSKGFSIDSENPQQFDKETIVSIGQNILRDYKDFFGMIDRNGIVLQFYMENHSEIWMEIVSPQEKGSYGKYIKYDDLENILSNLPENFSTETIGGLKFELW
jgi:hypothetical protein